MMLYMGEYMCPLCGLGSRDLNPNKTAIIVHNYGREIQLQCQMCHDDFLHRPVVVCPPSDGEERTLP